MSMLEISQGVREEKERRQRGLKVRYLDLQGGEEKPFHPSNVASSSVTASRALCVLPDPIASS